MLSSFSPHLSCESSLVNVTSVLGSAVQYLNRGELAYDSVRVAELLTFGNKWMESAGCGGRFLSACSIPPSFELLAGMMTPGKE